MGGNPNNEAPSLGPGEPYKCKCLVSYHFLKTMQYFASKVLIQWSSAIYLQESHQSEAISVEHTVCILL